LRPQGAAVSGGRGDLPIVLRQALVLTTMGDPGRISNCFRRALSREGRVPVRRGLGARAPLRQPSGRTAHHSLAGHRCQDSTRWSRAAPNRRSRSHWPLTTA